MEAYYPNLLLLLLGISLTIGSVLFGALSEFGSMVEALALRRQSPRAKRFSLIPVFIFIGLAITLYALVSVVLQVLGIQILVIGVK